MDGMDPGVGNLILGVWFDVFMFYLACLYCFFHYGLRFPYIVLFVFVDYRLYFYKLFVFIRLN